MRNIHFVLGTREYDRQHFISTWNLNITDISHIDAQQLITANNWYLEDLVQNLYSLLQSSHTCDLEVPGAAATCYIYTMWTLTSSTKHKICNVASYIVFSFFP